MVMVSKKAVEWIWIALLDPLSLALLQQGLLTLKGALWGRSRGSLLFNRASSKFLFSRVVAFLTTAFCKRCNKIFWENKLMILLLWSSDSPICSRYYLLHQSVAFAFETEKKHIFGCFQYLVFIFWHVFGTIKASEMLVAPRILECFGLGLL